MGLKRGWGIHCHHSILVEYVYNYDERVKAIKDKPQNEIKTRLKLFKILPKKALEEIPKACQQAWEAYRQAKKVWHQAEKAYRQAKKVWHQAEKACRQADMAWHQAEKACRQAYQQAWEAWLKVDKEAFHAKWCGCKNWNGEEIVFNRAK